LFPLVLLATVHGQDKQPEESAPVPTIGVWLVLDGARAASDAGDAAKALRLADYTLTVARKAADAPGEAQAQRTRALQLAKLNRTSEALAAWRDAEDRKWLKRRIIQRRQSVWPLCDCPLRDIAWMKADAGERRLEDGSPSQRRRGTMV
jgi:hypothetical protein